MSTAPLSPSPRQSLSIRSPISSSRTSLDQNNPARPTTTRRNRAALRDYYNLKPSAVAEDASESVASPPHDRQNHDSNILEEVDRAGFDASAYVQGILEREGLEGVLRVENGLVGEIRGLDGERKALVYDNYSKLIRATETIRKMRTNMDPLTPTTSTLAPAISHIAETATTLSRELEQNLPSPKDPEVDKRKKQKETVRWVLDAPRRLQQLIMEGRVDEAMSDWDIVRGLLDKWKGVQGTEAVQQACLGILREVDD
ncbi:hypothetical protein FKW77_002152 [Venturia effusa]|uniref:Vacuolar protein sorting-associated protein 51 homolog n=1 Tax=Venturia effusa TaxID=50376 RepID=A0A517L6S6_9PEZI|nr:hypothetical protein FKW77_002152 [Venturia effusa]